MTNEKQQIKKEIAILENLLERHEERLNNLRKFFYHVDNYEAGFELGYRNTLAGKTRAGRKLGKREAAKLEKQFIKSLEDTWKLPRMIEERKKQLAE